MKKAIIIGCVDPRLHAILPTVSAPMEVEASYMFRVAGPDGIWKLPELAIEKEGLIAGVQRLNDLAHVATFAFIGHTDCAGHKVSDDQHREDTKRAAQDFKHELSLDVPVHAMLAVRGASDFDWSLESLAIY